MSGSPKIAVVTGAGSGIGRLTALALQREGWSVALAGRRRETLDGTGALASAFAPRLAVIPTDVTDPESVARLFAETVKRFGRLDLLFNNAGTNAPALPLEDLSVGQVRAVIDTNLMGAMFCTREAMRIMKSQSPRGGRIINNGSVSAHVPRPNASPYNAAKHAITGLTKSTALDGRPFGITCGQIDIGNAETDMAAKMKMGVRQADGTTAVEPTFDPEHVARAVVFMAGLPLDANVPFLTIMATGMPYMGRG